MSSLDLGTTLSAALASKGGASSDFDLNPLVKLPKPKVLKQAAVLVAFHQDDGSLILTKRAAHLKNHPGQIAFAGGRMDDTDTSLEHTALREAQEEIGLDPSNVEIIGRLPPHETVTSYVAMPIVALVKDRFEYRPEASEVDEVFTVPFSHIADPANYRIEGRRWQGHKRYYFTSPFGPYYIWGATARILRGLADRISA